MQRFILVNLHDLEQVEPGTVIKRSAWPYHTTMVPWFDGEAASLQTALNGLVRSEQSFEAEIGAEDFFGPNKDIKVRVYANPQRLIKLHAALVQMLERRVNFVEPQYIRDGYRPHITFQPHEARHYEEGDTVSINNLTLVELIDNETTSVVEIYNLKSGTSDALPA